MKATPPLEDPEGNTYESLVWNLVRQLEAVDQSDIQRLPKKQKRIVQAAFKVLREAVHLRPYTAQQAAFLANAMQEAAAALRIVDALQKSGN